MYEAIQGKDIFDVLQPLLEKGWYISAKDGKVKCINTTTWDTPWIYVNPSPDASCTFNVNLSETAGIVPRYCRNCFKVVTRPRTVAELIQLYELMSTKFVELGLYCKCGIEPRSYVHGNYGGYNYNQGLKQGEESYEVIRKLINKEIGEGVGVILKRGCTEMELNFGPSKQYVVPDWADELEDKIMEVVELPKKNPPMPKYLKNHIIRKWLEFAWDRGDKTCLELSDGIPIFPNKIDTYHKEA